MMMTDTAADMDTDVAPASLPEAEKVIRGFVNEGLVPGAMISWGFSGGPVRHHAVGELGFGINRAIDEHSIFRIFSQTKPITGIAAMMLIEDGTIELDQPLGEILPDFADMRVMIAENPEDARPATHPITIRHLLTHTAGFGMSSMTLGLLYLKHGIAPGSHDRVAGPDELPTPASLAEMCARLAKLPLAADPGTRFDYSVALDVLGLVIEVASGMPFEAFLQQRLFAPLGMIDTGFSIAPAQVDRFAALHRRDGDAFNLADDPANSLYARGFYPAGGGGLVSTAHDYARFASMLLGEGELDGVRVLKPETVRLARSNLLPQGIDRVDLPIGQTLSRVGFGAAMSVSLRPGKRTGGAFDWPGDVPAGVFGWPGAAGTACWIDPERRFFLLFLTQYWPSWLNGSMRPDVIAAAYRDLASQA
jgi:CubicO group peptidase (beta-lactamase class C family)